jgi:uncharacterized phiE125 gp8 family phage protein
MRLKLIEAPTDYPITLAQALEHCRITETTEDTYVTVLIGVACEYAQSRTGRAIGAQTWERAFDCFPSQIELPNVPLIDVVSVTYIDPDGVETVLAADIYTVDTHSLTPRIIPAYGECWPSARAQVNAVIVRYTCGYFADPGSPASPPEADQALPKRLHQALLMLINEMYDTRQPDPAKLDGAFMGAIDALLRPLRVGIW